MITFYNFPPKYENTLTHRGKHRIYSSFIFHQSLLIDLSKSFFNTGISFAYNFVIIFKTILSFIFLIVSNAHGKSYCTCVCACVSSGNTPINQLDCKFRYFLFKKGTCRIHFLNLCKSENKFLEPLHISITLDEYGILETQLCLLEQFFSLWGRAQPSLKSVALTTSSFSSKCLKCPMWQLKHLFKTCL